MRFRKWLGLALFTCVGLAFVGCGSADSGGDFTVDLYTGRDILGGDTVTLESALELGKPVVLNFFGGDCPPCVVEMPRLQETWEDYRDEVLFLGVDIGPFTGLGSHVEGASLVADLGITFPAGSTEDSSVLPVWGINGLPETFFLNADGTQSSRWRGLISHAQLEEEIAGLLD